MRVIYLWLIFMVWVVGAEAGESTIVLMDNTTIKTVHHYEPVASQSANWEDVAIIKNPIAEANCFDRIANYANRADRYRQLDSCLTGVVA